MVFKKYALLLAVPFLFSCGEGSGVSDAGLAADVGRVLGAINGVMDEQSNASFSALMAGSCLDRASVEGCSSGSRTITYNECDMPSGTLEGTVTLAYKDNSCSMATLNNYVTRVPNLTKRGDNGSVTQIFSYDEEDYEGNMIGGGSRLTRKNAGYLLDVLGKHIEQESSTGFQGFDISMYTESSIFVTDDFSRSGRRLDGGSLRVSHSLQEYSSIYSFDDVGYNGSCCHPISGTIEIEFEGSVDGSAIIEFEGSCGAVTMTKDSRNSVVTIEDCNY